MGDTCIHDTLGGARMTQDGQCGRAKGEAQGPEQTEGTRQVSQCLVGGWGVGA